MCRALSVTAESFSSRWWDWQLTEKLTYSVDSLAKSCDLARRLANALGGINADVINADVSKQRAATTDLGNLGDSGAGAEADIGAKTSEPLCIFLDGPLGAGKTEWCRQIIRELGYSGQVTSPTYTLIEEYAISKHMNICHIDAYRLKDAEELAQLGLGSGEEYAEDMQLLLVEWGQERGCDKVLQADISIVINPDTSSELENINQATDKNTSEAANTNTGDYISGISEKRNIVIQAHTDGGQAIIKSLTKSNNKI